MMLLNKSGLFANDIRRWYDRLPIKNTWPNFQSHFRAAQKSIRNSTPTIDQLGFHNANLVQQIVTGLRDHFITEEWPNSSTTPTDNETISSYANVTQQTDSMVRQMQEMRATIISLQNQTPTSGGGRDRGGRGGQPPSIAGHTARTITAETNAMPKAMATIPMQTSRTCSVAAPNGATGLHPDGGGQ
jgi:hypothetical protein